MADNIFEGSPDARQAGDITPSRFRARYRRLSGAEIALHDAIKAKAVELEALFEQAEALRYPVASIIELDGVRVTSMADIEQRIASGTYQKTQIGDMSQATARIGDDFFGWGMKSLQEAVMWTVKGLTS